MFALSVDNKVKIAEAIRTFEKVGTQYKNINDLGNGLFEIKPNKVRAYFIYEPKRILIILVSLIYLKETQKALLRYIKQARKNIERYLNQQELKI